MSFSEDQIAHWALWTNNLFLWLFQKLLSLGPDHLDILQVRVEHPVDKGDVQAKVLGSLTLVAALGALLMIGKCRDILVELVRKMSSNMLTGWIPDVTDGTVWSDGLFLRF